MRAWTEISLDNIRYNLALVRSRVGADTLIMAVVKADAYGHGAPEVALALEHCGADRFAVATIGEGRQLRDAGVTLPIMTLGRSEPERIAEVADLGMIQTVGSLEYAEQLNAALDGTGKKLTVHFAVDTGMSRLGFETEDAALERSVESIRRAASFPNLTAEGIFTHFATSEIPNEPFQRTQLTRFETLLDMLKDVGVEFPIVHASNSGATVNLPSARFNMVRPGILLYGVSPDADVLPIPELRPAMALKARLVQIHDYADAVTVSYGRRFRSQGAIRTGTVSIGYADGLHRALSGKMSVLVRGKRAPQLGNICMDMMIVDLSGIPDARVGDTVTIFGADGDAEIRIEEVAAAANTIPYEIMCAPSSRVERIHK